MGWYAVLIALVAAERLAELVVAKRNSVVESGPGAGSSPVRATIRSWSSCTPGCWPGA